MKFTVQRSKWDRGRKGDNAPICLVGPLGNCCLGFVGQQCAVTGLLNNTDPGDVEADQWHKWPNWFFEGNSISDDVDEAMQINDARGTNDAETKSNSWINLNLKQT